LKKKTIATVEKAGRGRDSSGATAELHGRSVGSEGGRSLEWKMRLQFMDDKNRYFSRFNWVWKGRMCKQDDS
jgi:hypothetical protein